MQKTRSIIFLVIFILGTLTTVFAYDAYRLRQILGSSNPDVLGTRSVESPTPLPLKENPEAEIICEYINVLEQSVTKPDPLDDIQKNIGYQNNKVGLYIYAEVLDYVDAAAELANSNGGEWGYVLIPYNVKDYNTSRWGRLFEKLADSRLIPIIQLWDLDLDDDSKRDKQITESAEFLNSLKWPVKPRFISVYNEVNDSRFWKGGADPEEYAKILNHTIDAFKELNGNFFIMNGAFNASARTGGNYIDEQIFLKRMNAKVPGIFEKLDGWASHPYPQPNFSGKPQNYGRDSIRAYEWELGILEREFGINDLPVFITETGWAHKESEAHSSEDRMEYGLNQYTTADYFKYAFENVWLPDDRIVAITPFTVRYKPPHDHFSWLTQNGNPYPQFTAVKGIKKVKGNPPVITYAKSKVLECE